MSKSKQLNIGILIYVVGHHQAAWLEEIIMPKHLEKC